MPESSRDRELRPLPEWAQEASFGIFVHWGPYSVPAWAEPTGALGKVPPEEWFAHNPYAEWYANTIRIEGSPAAAHHLAEYGGSPYEEFLDAWTADRYDPAEWAKLFRAAGADYVIPVTKHHDGVTLWDAPGSGDPTTVTRGPRQDLIAPLADAVRADGMRFGVYYSGGLDWSFSRLSAAREPRTGPRLPTGGRRLRALRHRTRSRPDRPLPSVRDLERHRLARHRPGGRLARRPAARTTERSSPTASSTTAGVRMSATIGRASTRRTRTTSPGIGWENNRGLGFSFGFNRLEDAEQTLSTRELAQLYADVVSRGGRLLLNVGPEASGEIPALQREDAGRHRALDGGGQAAHRPSTARVARGSRGAADDGRVGAQLVQRRTTRRRHGSARGPRRPWRERGRGRSA